MYKHSVQFFGFYRDPNFVETANEWHKNTLYTLLTEAFGPDISFADLRLLEIGSGLAWMCRAAKALSPQFQTVAQDVTPEVKEECGWVDRYEVADIEDALFDELGPFDVISMTHVIEHIPDPVAVLRRAASLLKVGGVMFVSAPHRPTGWSADPTIETWQQWSYNHVPVHLQYFSQRSFELAAQTAGLDLQRWCLPGDGEVFEAWLGHAISAHIPLPNPFLLAQVPALPIEMRSHPVSDLYHRYLNPQFALKETQADFRACFQFANPFPHVALDNFFQRHLVDSLCSEFPRKGSNYDKYCIADDGEIGTNYANPNPADFPSVFQELDRILRSHEFLDFVEAVTGIDELVYDPDYFGGGIRESQASTFLPPHIDFNYHPRTLFHRRLNLLLYLNRDWEEAWGGAIQVHRDPRTHREDSLVASFPPVLNRCFIFETSERSWHGFNRLCPPPGRSRRAFTIYYYTEDRPDAEQVKLHNTEYVEPPLPPEFTAGYTLTEADAELLAEALGRRDDRIDMLYRLRREADAKYAHVWKEYEFYSQRSRELEEKLGCMAGGRETQND